MLRKTFLLAVLISINYTLLAQESVIYKGIIVDSVAAPIELVNVVAEESASQNIVSFGVTNSEGQFSLKLKKGVNYILKTSFVGYESLELEIIGEANSNQPMTVMMRPSITSLEAMEIVYEFPIVISGDTITYKSDAFTDGHERKLGDVLSSLPGFEVDEDGQVKVQGKQIDKILVDGKEFFEGDTKMATQNIPANAVDKVQLLRNFNQVSPLNNINDGDERIALNIKLSEDVKNLVFGDLEGGAGPDQRFLGHSNLFFYNKKTTLNFIGDLNNIGYQAFSPRDYFRFTGGFNTLKGHSGSAMNVSDADMGFSMLENNNALKISSKMGAFNFNYVPNKIWNFSGFSIFSSNDINIKASSNRTYVNTTEQTQEQFSNDETRGTTAGLLKLKANYTPSERLFLGFESFIKGSTLDKISSLQTDNLGTTNFINNAHSQEPLSFNQKLSGFYALNEKNLFSLEADYSYSFQNPELTIASSQLLFENQLTFPRTETPFLSQNNQLVSHQQNAIASWYRILNKTNHLSFNIGNSTSYQKFNTQLGSLANTSGSLSPYVNNSDLLFTDYFVGADYSSRVGKLIFKPSIKLHQYALNQGGNGNNMNETALLPALSMTYNILSSQRLIFRYEVNNSFSDIERLSSGLILKSYNNLFRGNEQLQFSQSDVFNLSYYNFSLFNNLNIYGGLSYQKRKRDFTDNQQYEGLERISSIINTKNPNQIQTGYAGASKTFEQFKIEGQATLSNTKTFNQINDQQNINENLNQSYSLSGETTLFKSFTISLKQVRSYNRYKSLTTQSQFVNINTSVGINWRFGKGLALTADYEYNDYSNKSGAIQSTYDFLNATIFYQKEHSQWQIKLSATNILNTEYIRRDSFSESLINSYTYFVQPRYALLTLKYEL